MSFHKKDFLKNIAAGVVCISLIGSSFFATPIKAKADPILFGFLLGAVLGVDIFSCSFNILFYCDNGGNVLGDTNGVSTSCNSSGNICGQVNTGFLAADGVTCSATPPDNSSCPCSSSANACGQTNTGSYVGNTNSCNASTPSNSSCPSPIIPTGTGFYPQPSTVPVNGTTVLHWNTSNSTNCTISGDNGFSTSGGASGSATTNALAQTTTFTLTCIDGVGGPSTSASVRVIITPRYQEI